jgi:hypothetical protein
LILIIIVVVLFLKNKKDKAAVSPELERVTEEIKTDSV